jgi:hypothetical protein
VQTQILSELNTDDADLAALAAQLDVPTVAGLQHQGDVSVIPADMARDYRIPTTVVPRAGVPVVRGESGGNTHLLLADGPVLLDLRVASATDLTLGCLLVPAGATAWLDHPEHGNTGIAPGAYVLRRKREQADELQLVAD